MQARAPMKNEKVPVESRKKLRSLNEWSTPERRIGTRKLSVIPTEMYLNIINYFHPLDELGPGECRVVWRSLGLVCRFFYSVTFPLLFRSLVFTHWQASRSQPNTLSFFRKLQLREEPTLSLSPHVKECIIRDWYDTDEGFFTLFLEVAGRMENLTTVILNRTLISAQVLKTIGKLQQLKSLQIDTCPFLYDDDGSEQLSSLRLTSFHLFRCAIIFRVFEPLMAHLEELRTDGWPARLLANHDNLCLRVLEIHIVDIFSVLSSVLAKTPMLSDLHLEVDPHVDEEFVPTPIPASLIRNLRQLRCHPRHFQYFSCTNLLEVVHLEISDPNAFLHLPVQFHISPHVRTLHVPGYLLSPDVALSVSVYFPNVEQLTIIIRDGCDFGLPELGEDFDERVCAILKARDVPTRTLRELHLEVDCLDGEPFIPAICIDLSLQRRMINNLEREGFTNLVRVSFMRHVSWRRLGSGEWEPFVHYEHRRAIRGALQHFPYRVVDPYGCLESVFQLEVE